MKKVKFRKIHFSFESQTSLMIVNTSLPPAHQMDDGKSIRYKDLYALFEHILEKTMRLEQRDWCESPVKVWVNTFKVFLDEFMTEYKPAEGTIGRVRELGTHRG